MVTLTFKTTKGQTNAIIRQCVQINVADYVRKRRLNVSKLFYKYDKKQPNVCT